MRTDSKWTTLYLHCTPTHGDHLKQGDSLHLSLFNMATSCFSFVFYFGTSAFAILRVFEANPASPLRETKYQQTSSTDWMDKTFSKLLPHLYWVFVPTVKTKNLPGSFVCFHCQSLPLSEWGLQRYWPPENLYCEITSEKLQVKLHLNPKEKYNLGLHTLCSLRIWMKLWARVSFPPRICMCGVQSSNSAYGKQTWNGSGNKQPDIVFQWIWVEMKLSNVGDVLLSDTWAESEICPISIGDDKLTKMQTKMHSGSLWLS